MSSHAGPPHRATQLGCACLAVLACAATLAVFFRDHLLNRFSFIFGDINDARIEIALLEHWFNVLRGLEGWRNPIFLVPTKDVLGYNDGYFLFGMLYSAFRAAGSDPFLAADLVHASLRAIGFAGFLLFATRACRLPFGWALAGASAFTLSNAAYMQIGHAQLLSVGFAPVLGCLVFAAGQALLRHDAARAAGWGCAAALLFDAWLLTAFYMLWFMLFFSALALAATAVLAAGGQAPGWRAWLRAPRWPVGLAAAVLLAGAAPFVLTYWPTARLTGMHPVAQAMIFVPAPLDLLNVGQHNLLLGRLNAWLNAVLRPGAALEGEWAVGFPWFALALSLVGCGAALLSAPGPGRLFWRAASAAFLVSLALCVGVNGHTLWRYVYSTVPGAAAVRVICRYLLFLGFPSTLLAIHALSRRRWPTAVAVAAVLLLVGEEITTQPQSALSRTEELAFLAAIPLPPASCKAFAVVQPRTPSATEAPAYALPLVPNTDGMLVAEWLHVPTLNGHASFLPAHFGLGFAAGPFFHDRVRRAVIDRGLGPRTCGLDLERRRWEAAPIAAGPALDLTPGLTVEMGGMEANAGGYLQQGWGAAEETGRWTVGRLAEMTFAVPGASRPLRLEVTASALTLGGPPSRVTVLADGEPVAEWTPAGPVETLKADLPGAGPSVHLEFMVADPRRPRDFSASPDDRSLGLFVHSLRIVTTPQAPR